MSAPQPRRPTRGSSQSSSLAETIVMEAFTPGVRPISFQILNVVLGALMVCLGVAIFADPKNIHLYVLGSLSLILILLVNYYSQVFLESSREADERERRLREMKQRERETQVLARKAQAESESEHKNQGEGGDEAGAGRESLSVESSNESPSSSESSSSSSKAEPTSPSQPKPQSKPQSKSRKTE